MIMAHLSAKSTSGVMKPGNRFASQMCLLCSFCSPQHTTEPEEVSGGAVERQTPHVYMASAVLKTLISHRGHKNPDRSLQDAPDCYLEHPSNLRVLQSFRLYLAVSSSCGGEKGSYSEADS